MGWSRLGGVALVCGAIGCTTGRGGLPDEGDATTDPGPAPCADSGAVAGEFFPCDVEAVLSAKCRRCHDSDAVLDVCVANDTCVRAPFPLLVWSDTRRNFADGERPVDRLEDVISSGFMPYQTTAIEPPVQRLTAVEKDVMLSWARACAPGAATSCADSGAASGRDSGSDGSARR